MSWLMNGDGSGRRNQKTRGTKRNQALRPRQRQRPRVEQLETRLTPSTPSILSLTPPDDAAEVALGANLQILFSENVEKGSGNIVIRRQADNSALQTIAVSSSQVTVSGSTVTIDPSVDLVDNAGYYVQIDAGAFRSTRKLLLSEDFEGGGSLSELRPFVSTSESNGNGTDWTDQLPAGWRRDNTTTPAAGPVEFFGWNVFDKVSWGATAGDQDRSAFTRGRGNVIVADGDEYDDIGDIDPNLMNVLLFTPTISLAGTAANSVTLDFDSSFRPEGTQTGVVEVSFNGGTTWTNVLTLNTANSGGDGSLSRANQHLTINVNNPASGTMLVRFGYNAGNNWWWAVDNIVVRANALAGNGDAFPGISANTTWNFSTGGLVVTTLSPADNGLDVDVGANLVLTFDEAVRVGPGTGNIVIRRVADDSIVQVINVASAPVTFSGNTVTINPPSDLPDKTGYYVQIDPGAIRDQSNNLVNTTLFLQNFEGLPLGRFPNEPYISGVPIGTVKPGVVGDGTDFTQTPPPGWSIDNGQMPAGGVPEWRGWTFADKASWNDVDAGQFRSDFTRGTGTVAVADPDEWNDANNTTGVFRSFLLTPNLSLVGTVANTVTLEFDSSFRPLGQQKAVVDVSFDGGTTWTNVLTRNSATLTAGDRSFTNERPWAVTVNNPTSGTVRFRFGLIDAADGYWWAIDNIEVRANVTGNTFEGITDKTRWNFTTRDITAPQIVSLTPPDDGFGPLDTNLVITFNEPVQKGTGNIVLRRFADDSVVETIAVTSTLVTVNANTVTINPTNDLVLGTQYYVLVDAGAIRDMATVPNNFVGITNKNAWNFFAGDVFGPVVDIFTPADNSTNVPVGANLVIRFNEGVRVGPGTGFIVIRRVSDDSVVASVNVNSPRVTFSGNTVTIDPTNDLPPGTALYVQFDQAAVRDLSTREVSTFLLREDFERTFENPKLGPFREETGGDGTDWTNVAPFGWAIDNSREGGVPGVSNPADNNGVFDWAGWAFADRPTWATVAGDQRRSEFARGTGTVAIADPDEWDDAPDPAGLYNTYLQAPRIYLTDVRANSLQLRFDSSWRPEGMDDGDLTNNQTAVIRFIYNRGLTTEQTVEVLKWDSDPTSATFHGDFPNEEVIRTVTAPAGAQTLDIEVGLLRAANDWWWAIDNLEITATMVSNPFAGILDTRTVWNFTTAGQPGGGNPPPMDHPTDPISPVEGETIAVMSSLVPLHGTMATINPAGSLAQSSGGVSGSFAGLALAVLSGDSSRNFLAVPTNPATLSPAQDVASVAGNADARQLMLPADRSPLDEGNTLARIGSEAPALELSALSLEAPFELTHVLLHLELVPE